MGLRQASALEPVSGKRPVFVWVLSIFFVFSIGWAAVSSALIYFGLIPLDDTQKAYFESQTTMDLAFALVTGALNLVGAILLFLLRKRAFHCFLAAFASGILLTVYNLTIRDWGGAIEGPEVLRPLSGWLVSLIAILYSQKLMKEKVLR